MIFILSEENDHITTKVIEWLRVYEFGSILRINSDDKITVNSIVINNTEDEIAIQFLGNKLLHSNDITFFWYRRGEFSFNSIQLESYTVSPVYEKLNDFLNWEVKVLMGFIMSEFSKKRSLGNYENSTVNKLNQLVLAKECGFRIPITMISEDSLSLKQFSRRNFSISKPIGEAMTIFHDKFSLTPLTVDGAFSVFESECFDTVFPSLLQEKIDKWIEIRVFIMYDEIFSMAIFSQNNNQTKTDFRDYDYDLMNRMVPFKLPDDIVKKIHLFMEKAGLDTGSIDLILSKNGEYVFLEVNPAGNIEMVSDTCNYYIEKRIAERIIEEINNEPRAN